MTDRSTSPSASTPHVVVVGGGLAGLAAALTAADAGMQVTLLEKRPRLGGATWSFERHGISYDNGQHVFMRCFKSYRAFLARIGAADQVFLQPKLDVPVLSPSGKTGSIKRTNLPAPLHLAKALLTYPHLSFAERISAMRTALALGKLGRSLPPDVPPEPGASVEEPSGDDGDGRNETHHAAFNELDRQTFGSWLRDRGESIQSIDKLWNLIVLPTTNLPANEVSLLLAVRVFATGLLQSAAAGDIGWPKVPLSELHGTAAAAALAQAGVQVLTQTSVERVTSEPLGVELADSAAQDAPSSPTFLPADAVVLAVPHTAAGDILPSGAVATQQQLADLGTSPIINVHIVYDRVVFDQPFAGVVDNQAQFIFDRTDSAQLNNDSHQCLGVSLSAANEYLHLKPAELIELMAAEIEQVLPAARTAGRVEAMVTKEVAATFRGAPGTNRLRPGPRTAAPGVFLAGAWTDTGWPATMEGAVRSGIVASNHALGFLRGAKDDRGSVREDGKSAGESGMEMTESMALTEA